MSDTQKRLKEGVSDAFGFGGSALADDRLGFDVFAQGSGGANIIGIAAVGLGGGLGLGLARRWRTAQQGRN